MNTNMYIIGAFSNGKLAQKYFNSLSVLGENVEPIIIQYLNRGTFDKVLVPKNVTLIKYQKEYPGNTGKHKDFHEVIAPLLKEDKWCMFTDMHDVLFQAPLPDLDNSVDMYVSPEGRLFGEIIYWKDILPQKTLAWDAYNVGSFIMKRDILLEFWSYLYKQWVDFYQWYKYATIPRIGNGDTFPFNIPFHDKIRIDMALMFNNNYDTLCFNEFLRRKVTKDDERLFACYAYLVKTKIATYTRGKLFRNGTLVSVAHFNGSSKTKMRKEVV